MSSTQDLATVAQSNVDVLIALSTKAFEGAEKLAALNLKVAKAGLAEAAESSQAVLASKDAQSLLAVQSGVVQPAAAKAGEYATAVAAIMTETKTELDKVLAQSAADAKSKFAAMVEAAMKNAPAGSTEAMALWKSAFEGATNGYEALQKAAKQASDVAQANYAAVSGSVTKATKARRVV
jgi:phasin family protein